MPMTGNETQAVREAAALPAPAVAPIDRRSLNVPNLITLSRLALSFVLFTLIWAEGLWIESAALFVFAASTDAVDGWVARRYGQVTTLGRILDPFVDKIIICGTFIFLLDKKVRLGTGEIWSGVNAWMVIIVVGREMFVSSLRGFLEQHGKDFAASLSGKLKMLFQCLAVTASLVSLSPRVNDLWPQVSLYRSLLLWAAVLVTLYSGLVYVWRAVVLLRPRPEPLP